MNPVRDKTSEMSGLLSAGVSNGMRFHVWYVLFSLFFIVLAVESYMWLIGNGKFPTSVSLMDLVLMALATMRLVRLFTYDIITDFVREWFVGADPNSLRGTLGALINCPWCTGLWFAAMVGFFYYATPFAWYVILVLALSSLATSFQLLANLIGWHAEAKKRGVER